MFVQNPPHPQLHLLGVLGPSCSGILKETVLPGMDQQPCAGLVGTNLSVEETSCWTASQKHHWSLEHPHKCLKMSEVCFFKVILLDEKYGRTKPTSGFFSFVHLIDGAVSSIFIPPKQRMFHLSKTLWTFFELLSLTVAPPFGSLTLRSFWGSPLGTNHAEAL